jgi:hypothetical protein
MDGKIWASRWERHCLESCSASYLVRESFGKLLGEPLEAIVAHHVKPSSSKVMGESLKEALTVSDKNLGEGVAERDTTGGDTRQVSCSVRASSGKSLEEVLPVCQTDQ